MLYDEIAAGGMASVHLGRLIGPVGFSRTVAIKRLHQTFAKDPEFVSMFLDEARLAARVRHPNVVSVLDVVALESELFLVMDYVQGESLARLLRASRDKARMPVRVAVAIATSTLYGLHAAHEARDEQNEPLCLVHRDVSPQNILVGVDGIARVVDFGVAKAANRVQTTRGGQLKGKLSYMSPEQVRCEPVDRRTDIYAASVVLWETLCGKRLFHADEPAGVVARIMAGNPTPPRSVVPDLPDEVDRIVQRGLAFKKEQRFATARDMALALEHAVAPAPAAVVGAWVEEMASQALARRAGRVAEVESHSDVLPRPVLGSLPEQLLIGDNKRASTVRSEPAALLSGPGNAADSQASSLTVSSSVSGAARRRRRAPLAIALVITAGLAGAVWLALRARSESAASAASATKPTLSQPTVVSVAPRPLPAPSKSVAVHENAPASPSPSPSASAATAVVPPTARRRVPRKARANREKKVKSASTPGTTTDFSNLSRQ